jgi:superfamily II DNA or RNA helicase
MPKRTSPTGSELFIVDNSDTDWKAVRYLHDWCQISKAIDVATGYFELGSLLALNGEWQKVDKIRILMGAEVSLRSHAVFQEALAARMGALDGSIEEAKHKNDFLDGVPDIVEALKAGRIECRVYRKEKFHAKAYITHARMEVVGSAALVGSSNFTYPGLTDNVELNVQITGAQVAVLQEWYEHYWESAEDVSLEMLKVIERHVNAYTPFDVYAKALQELLKGHEETASEWELHGSAMYPVLDKYQQDGYQNLIKIASQHKGALLCDGVGLGKTFVGLMLIERFVVKERKNVLLLVPKSGRKSVWEPAIRRYLPQVGGGDFSSLVVLNHTDLNRDGDDLPARLRAMKDKVDVVIIDEAHNFRNPGPKGDEVDPESTAPGKIVGTGRVRPSRYRRLFELVSEKQLFLLTATPINNKLDDFRHLVQLFSREQPDYFGPTLGIQSLQGHFRQLEKQLESATRVPNEEIPTETNLEEAKQVLAGSPIFSSLVVQRSRAYVRESQALQGKGATIFPDREAPKVAEYSVEKTFGPLLDTIERAFSKTKPLFALPIYYPLAYYKGPKEDVDPFQDNRQKQVVALIRVQFLKRFESSIRAFETSCERLFLKLLAFVESHVDGAAEKRRLKRWKDQHDDLITTVVARYRDEDVDDEDPPDDVVPAEFMESVVDLHRDLYRVEEIIDETFLDLDQIIEFLKECQKRTAVDDDKLRALKRLLAHDPVMSRQKVLIFSEFADTARYLHAQLKSAKVEGVEEIDGDSKVDRAEVIKRFAPYYNESSSEQLKAAGKTEIRVLISTDILAEGLNLQDATRLINYDIHWNPVKLMQRIGRVDRRLNPEVEAAIVRDHPEQASLRAKVAYWNFLPPKELDNLLGLYRRVAHKTLRISKALGIEGRTVLTEDDPYEALKDFNAQYEGSATFLESIHLEWQKLLTDNPSLDAHLGALPLRVFSGRRRADAGGTSVFLCYSLPALDAETGQFTERAGTTGWYLYDLTSKEIVQGPESIVSNVRSAPETERVCTTSRESLRSARLEVERHITNTYLKRIQAPVGVKPVLKCWMELN